jgi:hypothetical protein
MVALQIKMALQGRLDQYDRALATAETGAVRSAVNRIRTQGRRQIQKAGLGRLVKTWRGVVTGESGQNLTRRGATLDPTGRVYSTAAVKGRVDDLLDVFEKGMVITPKGGRFLAIPTALAGGRRALPAASYPEGTFRLVPVGARGRGKRTAQRYVLVHKARNEVWYVLVPSVTLRKRIAIRPIVLRIAEKVPADLDRRWARAVARLERGVL